MSAQVMFSAVSVVDVATPSVHSIVCGGVEPQLSASACSRYPQTTRAGLRRAPVRPSTGPSKSPNGAPKATSGNSHVAQTFVCALLSDAPAVPLATYLQVGDPVIETTPTSRAKEQRPAPRDKAQELLAEHTWLINSLGQQEAKCAMIGGGQMPGKASGAPTGSDSSGGDGRRQMRRPPERRPCRKGTRRRHCSTDWRPAGRSGASQAGAARWAISP